VALAGRPLTATASVDAARRPLAARFGCSRSNISYIVSGKSWSHLEGVALLKEARIRELAGEPC
jgi:hypothetical protein